MIFLIEYNRGEGRIVTEREFDSSQRREADNARLDVELDLNRRGIDHEVVLLEAADREALYRTHMRYFESIPHILQRTAEAVETAGTTKSKPTAPNTPPARPQA